MLCLKNFGLLQVMKHILIIHTRSLCNLLDALFDFTDDIHHQLFDSYLFITKLVTYLQTVRIWRNPGDGNYACGHTLNDHSAEVSMNLSNSYSLFRVFVMRILFVKL